MERYRQCILMATVVALLLVVGCKREEMVDINKPGNNTSELRFRPSLAEANSASRASESDNDALQIASAAGDNPPHIAIETYTGTPGISLEKYFSDELGYFNSGSYWDINSGKPRFLPSDGMNLYAYFATNSAGKGAVTSVDYNHPVTVNDHPTLDFRVAPNDATNQVDLIAAKVEGIVRPEVIIPFKHILSQINFGVKGIDKHQVMIKNIRINKVLGSGTFDYKRWEWKPDSESTAQEYRYYFPDRKEGEATTGLGDSYKTRGTVNDSQNSYIFGDGGKFGSGKDTTFFYAQVDPTMDNFVIKDKMSTTLNNSLMLLPQEIKKNPEATVTLDYEIRLGGTVVKSGVNTVVRLDIYYDWKPNYRYVYLFNFENPSHEVTFDVLVEPWQTYNNGDGIVETDELTGVTLFQKYVSKLKSGESYSVPIGTLTSDFVCDWSLYTLENTFLKDQKFTVSFDDARSFAKGKSVIIKPPFGFQADVLSLNAPGKITFTASSYSYYATSTELNLAIASGGGNYEFNVSNAIKLNEISFVGSSTAESSLTLHYLSKYSENTPPGWLLMDSKTAVCYPKDYALISNVLPLAYTIYTMKGLKQVLDWMNTGTGTNPGGSNSMPDFAQRMQTSIKLAPNGRYNLSDVYKASETDTKPAFVPIGTSAIPYSGNFNGQGATVDGLYINNPSAEFQGFFGAKNNIVQNLNLTNVTVKGWNYTGGIAGLNSYSQIINCTVSGSVSGNDNVGGVVGSNWDTIIGCGSSASVYGGTVGGVVGNGGFVTACYSTGALTAWTYMGGITGTNAGHHTTTACYSNCTFTGMGAQGAIVGNDAGTLSNCYYIAPSNIGTQLAGVTRLPSVASLNGKIPVLNSALKSKNATVHYLSGNLNATAPTIAEGAPAERAGGAVLKGTFIQNWFALYWDDIRWNEEMAYLASLGMDYLVIDQVMECYVPLNGDTPKYMAWYPATANTIVNTPSLYIDSGIALEKCMDACRAHGIKLYIGTFFDKRYWDGGVAVNGKETEWNNCITSVNRVMDELITFYFNGSGSSKKDYTDVLAGWYFPYEVDDFSFQSDPAQTILKNGIREAMTHRNSLANTNARKPYLFSPFMNGSGPFAIKGTMDALHYGALWSDIIKNTGFIAGDILSPQDCIGIQKLLLSDLPVWMPELRKATEGVTGVNFWINIELFGPGGNAPFLINQQIPASKPYANNFISFSYPIHYSPNSHSRLGDHYVYKSYYDKQ